MGYRLHVCKTYKVEYGPTTGFNLRKEELITLLEAFGCTCYGSGDYNENDTFEVAEEAFSSMLSQMSDIITKGIDNASCDIDIDDLLDAVKGAYGVNNFVQYAKCDIMVALREIHQQLSDFYAEADKGDDYLHFCFF